MLLKLKTVSHAFIKILFLLSQEGSNESLLNGGSLAVWLGCKSSNRNLCDRDSSAASAAPAVQALCLRLGNLSLDSTCQGFIVHSRDAQYCETVQTLSLYITYIYVAFNDTISLVEQLHNGTVFLPT